MIESPRLLRALIDRVIELYPGHRRLLERELLLTADRDEWPDWAVQCLPRLFFDTTKTETPVPLDENRYCLWRFYTQLLEGARPVVSYRVRQNLCQSEVCCISVPPETSRFLAEVVPSLEHTRLHHPYSSVRSLEGALLDQMAALEQEFFPSRRELGRLIRQARIYLQKHLGVKRSAVPSKERGLSSA